MNIFFLIFFAAIVYITIPICQIVWHDLLDKDLIFLLCTNYLLIFLLTMIFSYDHYLIYSILISLTLVIMAFFLVRKIKSIFGRYQLLSLPYFGLMVFIFANILVLI